MTLIRRHPVLGVIGFVLLVFAVIVAASGFVVWQEAHHDDASDVETADAIVVLGAAQYDGVPSPVFQGRLDHAALLFEQDRAPTVIVLGANQPGDRYHRGRGRPGLPDRPGRSGRRGHRGPGGPHLVREPAGRREHHAGA